MTKLEITDLPRYIAWADGFLPSSKRLESLLLPEFKDKLQEPLFEKDHPYLRTMETTMRTRYRAKQCSTTEHITSDVYIIAPTHNPCFPHKYSPVQEELRAMKSRTEEYRLFCMVLSEQVPNELKEVFFDSLAELKFELKQESSYKDLLRFKKFLYDLSYTTIVGPYYAPSIRVEDDLKCLGFSAECNPVT